MSSSADQDEILSELRGHVARLERSTKITARVKATLPFGLPCLDHHLPGGLPLGALHELEPGRGGPEHGAAAILFTAGSLARLKGAGDVVPGLPRPVRTGAGPRMHPDRVIYADTWRDAEVLPVIEEGVHCPGLAGVVGEIGRLSLHRLAPASACGRRDGRRSSRAPALARRRDLTGERRSRGTGVRPQPAGA